MNRLLDIIRDLMYLELTIIDATERAIEKGLRDAGVR